MSPSLRSSLCPSACPVPPASSHVRPEVADVSLLCWNPWPCFTHKLVLNPKNQRGGLRLFQPSRTRGAEPGGARFRPHRPSSAPAGAGGRPEPQGRLSPPSAEPLLGPDAGAACALFSVSIVFVPVRHALHHRRESLHLQ